MYQIFNFLRVCPHTRGQNNVAQVINIFLAKQAFGELDKELVIMKAHQYLMKMPQMFLCCSTVNQNVIKKITNLHKKEAKIWFIVAWKVEGAFVKPNAMTRNL